MRHPTRCGTSSRWSFGKEVLLTGATGGLGHAIARGLADRGAGVILSSRKPRARRSFRGSLPGGHRVVVADLAEPGAAVGLLAEAARSTCWSPTRRCRLPGSWTATAPSRSSGRSGSTGGPDPHGHALLEPWLARGSGTLRLRSSLNAQGGDRSQLALLGHQVGPARLRARPGEDLRETAVGSPFRDAGHDPRGRDVRRLRRQGSPVSERARPDRSRQA